MTKIQFIGGPLNKEVFELDRPDATIEIPILLEDVGVVIYERSKLTSISGMIYYRLRKKKVINPVGNT